jgi:hypothetical protein
MRIQKRDGFILEALAKMRFLATTQIATLAFGTSRWAAQKRMRKLLDSALVRVWIRSLNEENVYSLDREGAKLLGGRVTVPRGLDGNLDHLLGINQVRIACALALSSIGAELIRWKSDWDLRNELRSRVIPDALVDVRWIDGSFQTFALEVDHRSRSTRGFLKKLLGYTASGILNHVILFAGHDSQWVERYRQALARTRLAPRVWFATFETLEAQGPTAAIWQSPSRADRYSLRDLSAFPYGKEGRSADSLDTTAS